MRYKYIISGSVDTINVLDRLNAQGRHFFFLLPAGGDVSSLTINDLEGLSAQLWDPKPRRSV